MIARASLMAVVLLSACVQKTSPPEVTKPENILIDLFQPIVVNKLDVLDPDKVRSPRVAPNDSKISIGQSGDRITFTGRTGSQTVPELLKVSMEGQCRQAGKSFHQIVLNQQSDGTYDVDASCSTEDIL